MIENMRALLKKTMDQAHEQLWWVIDILIQWFFVA